MKISILLLAALISLASADIPLRSHDVSLRPGDSYRYNAIEYEYEINFDTMTTSYHGTGGALCCACNTTVERYVISREGNTYCRTCWEAYLFD